MFQTLSRLLTIAPPRFCFVFASAHVLPTTQPPRRPGDGGDVLQHAGDAAPGVPEAVALELDEEDVLEGGGAGEAGTAVDARQVQAAPSETRQHVREGPGTAVRYREGEEGFGAG